MTQIVKGYSDIRNGLITKIKILNTTDVDEKLSNIMFFFAVTGLGSTVTLTLKQDDLYVDSCTIIGKSRYLPIVFDETFIPCNMTLDKVIQSNDFVEYDLEISCNLSSNADTIQFLSTENNDNLYYLNNTPIFSELLGVDITVDETENGNSTENDTKTDDTTEPTKLTPVSKKTIIQQIKNFIFGHTALVLIIIIICFFLCLQIKRKYGNSN